MFDKLSPVFRLLFCVLLSTGLHGGLAFYDWMAAPAESRLVHAPVMVALLPAVEVLPSTPTVTPQETSARPSSRSSAKIAESVPPKKVVKALPRSTPVDNAVKKPQENSPSPETVCLAPQEVVSESRQEMYVEKLPEVVPVEVVSEVAEQGDVDNSLEGSSFSAAQSLIEAVPNYRSNPLPEYPYLARRKHWEGIVWLLVDVSADGSVDELRVEQSCGHMILDRAATRTVRRWQFTPAKRAGMPVSSQVRLPVRFRLEDGKG